VKRTVITVAAAALLLAGCKAPPMSSVGFHVTDVHGPGLKGGNHVTCANANTDFNVTLDSDAAISAVHVGDLCPSGNRW
jgi:hypothetical protein